MAESSNDVEVSRFYDTSSEDEMPNIKSVVVITQNKKNI